jgi:hypothetical protein
VAPSYAHAAPPEWQREPDPVHRASGSEQAWRRSDQSRHAGVEIGELHRSLDHLQLGGTDFIHFAVGNFEFGAPNARHRILCFEKHLGLLGILHLQVILGNLGSNLPLHKVDEPTFLWCKLLDLHLGVGPDVHE